jgi:hypothetical protein
MKKMFKLLILAMLTLSMIACSSNSAEPAPKDAPKAAETPVASNVPSGSTATAETPKEPEASTATPAETTPGQTETPTEPAAAQAETPATPTDAKTAPTSQPAQSDNKPAPAPKPEATPAPAPAPVAQPEPPAQPEISPKGKKLLLVGREKAQEDIVVANRLKALGFSVTIMIDREFTPAETKGFDVIYISQTLNSKIIKDGVMKNVAVPTVYAKNHGMFYLGLSSIEEDADVLGVKTIDIADANHKVAGGLSGTVQIFKEANDKAGIGFGLPGKEAKVVATAPGDSSKAAIYYYDKGAKADNGYETKARISFFFMNNGLHENMTESTWKLLENTVVWTLQNG